MLHLLNEFQSWAKRSVKCEMIKAFFLNFFYCGKIHIKFTILTILKYTVQWQYVHSQYCVIITLSSSRILHHPKQKLGNHWGIISHPIFSLAPANLSPTFFCLYGFSCLGTSWKRNHTMFVVFCPFHLECFQGPSVCSIIKISFLSMAKWYSIVFSYHI